MTTTRRPAVSLAAVPGRRKTIVELATEIERRGFQGIYCPSLGDNLALCLALALETDSIEFGTSITPIYTRHVVDFAQNVATIHELSDGRFRFGIGVSHGPVHERLGVSVGKPLSDTRRFVSELQAVPRVGELPPIVLATLRDKMLALSAEIADGAVFANGSRSHMTHSVGVLGERAQDEDFFLGNMIPTVISDDIDAAAARNRKTLAGYVALPNYRNYWKAAGFEEEMVAAETALEANDTDALHRAMSDRWLSDVTLYGPVSRVREGVEAWFDKGIKTPILVPSSAAGNQLKAFEELFDAWS